MAPPCTPASRSGHSGRRETAITYNRWRLGTNGAVTKLKVHWSVSAASPTINSDGWRNIAIMNWIKSRRGIQISDLSTHWGRWLQSFGVSQFTKEKINLST